jgi:membrane protein implicated in regulation of membrane protease activity
VLLLIGGTLAYLFVPWPWWLVVVIILAGAEVFEASMWLRLRRRRPLTGHESLVGERGVLAGPGRVRIRGTSYPARVVSGEGGSPADAGTGVRVEVVAVEGMTLVVRPVDEP